MPASAGVICASDKDVDEVNPTTIIILRPEIRQQVYQIIQQFITIENKQIIKSQ
jgi:hypothetical protein